jgi:hypothetical protein
MGFWLGTLCFFLVQVVVTISINTFSKKSSKGCVLFCGQRGWGLFVCASSSAAARVQRARFWRVALPACRKEKPLFTHTSSQTLSLTHKHVHKHLPKGCRTSSRSRRSCSAGSCGPSCTWRTKTR